MACSRPAERGNDMKIVQIQSHVYSEKMKNLEQLEVRLREVDGCLLSISALRQSSSQVFHQRLRKLSR